MFGVCVILYIYTYFLCMYIYITESELCHIRNINWKNARHMSVTHVIRGCTFFFLFFFFINGFTAGRLGNIYVALIQLLSSRFFFCFVWYIVSECSGSGLVLTVKLSLLQFPVHSSFVLMPSVRDTFRYGQYLTVPYKKPRLLRYILSLYIYQHCLLQIFIFLVALSLYSDYCCLILFLNIFSRLPFLYKRQHIYMQN